MEIRLGSGYLDNDIDSRTETIYAYFWPIWYDIIGEASIANAILDRLLHTSHRIELKWKELKKKL